MLSGDSEKHTKQRETMGGCLYHDQWKKQVKEFYEDITIKLLREKSCKIAGVNQVDITREYVPSYHLTCLTLTVCDKQCR